MKTLASRVRAMALVLSRMEVEADLLSNVKNTWDAIKETDLGKKVEVFVQRAGGPIKRWLESHTPGIAKAISDGTGGTLILTPAGELMSKDRQIRFKL